LIISNFIIETHDRWPQKTNKPNVFLIVVDTLRADHLSCYGYGKKTSPKIDGFAEEATLFKSFFTVFPRTTPSAASIYTGLYPHSHGTRTVLSGQKKWNLNLAEILKNENYITGAVVNQYCLVKGSNFDQGFSHYKNVKSDLAVNQGAKAFLSEQKDKKKPVFLVLWYFNTHWPYKPSREFMPNTEPKLKELFARGKDMNKRAHDSTCYNQQEKQLLINAYDGSINSVDKEVGKIIDYLKRENLYDNSIILFTSDHGESLADHNYGFTHGTYYYDTTAMVPFIIKMPYQNKGNIREYQARNIDIFPTILSELKIDYACEGTNLFPKNFAENEKIKSLLAFGDNDFFVLKDNPKRHITGIKGIWRVVRTNKWKLIYIPHPENNIFELYDIINDPSELNNLINDPVHQRTVEQLKDELFKWIKPEDMEKTKTFPLGTMSDRELEAYRSLGYLQ
jgi:arylsulfatase A-like enzyme